MEKFKKKFFLSSSSIEPDSDFWSQIEQYRANAIWFTCAAITQISQATCSQAADPSKAIDVEIYVSICYVFLLRLVNSTETHLLVSFILQRYVITLPIDSHTAIYMYCNHRKEAQTTLAWPPKTIIQCNSSSSPLQLNARKRLKVAHSSLISALSWIYMQVPIGSCYLAR